MGEYLKNPHLHVSPFRKAKVEYPFYDKESLNKDLEKFVKEATPRKIDKSNTMNTNGISKKDSRKVL
jgi:hypothetical protein